MSKTKTDHETLWEMIKETRFGMLTHRHPEGMLHAHPLTTVNKKLDEGVLYFFVSKQTELGQRLQADGNVNVSYSNPDKDQYVSVSGNATISEDKDIKQRLFNPLMKAWFPGGWEDPELELVVLHISHAEYWNVKESKASQLLEIAKSAVTGEKAHLGEKKEVHFN